MANATRQADLSLTVGRLHESVRQAGPHPPSPRFCTLTPAADFSDWRPASFCA